MARAFIDDAAVLRIITTAINASLGADVQQLGEPTNEGFAESIRVVSLNLQPQARHNQDLVVDVADVELTIECRVSNATSNASIYAIARLAARIAKALDGNKLADSAGTHRLQFNRVTRLLADTAAGQGGEPEDHSNVRGVIVASGRVQRDTGDSLET